MLTLTELAKRRRGEIDAPSTPIRFRTNDALDCLAESTFQTTEERMERTPIRSKADALAALDVIWEDLEF